MSLTLECPTQTCSWLDRLETSVSEELLPSAGATAARALILRVDAIRDALAQAEAGAILRQLAERFPDVRGLLTVGADSNLSHRADRILSQGWKPPLRGSAVDKFSS